MKLYNFVLYIHTCSRQFMRIFIIFKHILKETVSYFFFSNTQESNFMTIILKKKNMIIFSIMYTYPIYIDEVKTFQSSLQIHLNLINKNQNAFLFLQGQSKLVQCMHNLEGMGMRPGPLLTHISGSGIHSRVLKEN